VFNALDSLDAVEGAAVLDPFAGSGALAIEALSRGATRATLCETSAPARQVIEANLAATGFADRARVAAGPGERSVAAGGPWDLVLLDPPYDFAGWDDLLARLVPELSAEAVVVVESDHEVAVAPHLRVIRSKRYGGTVVLFAVPPGAPS
jgi:16S rRNA (guanine966-N2)-methyltransferase